MEDPRRQFAQPHQPMSAPPRRATSTSSIASLSDRRRRPRRIPARVSVFGQHRAMTPPGASGAGTLDGIDFGLLRKLAFTAPLAAEDRISEERGCPNRNAMKCSWSLVAGSGGVPLACTSPSPASHGRRLRAQIDRRPPEYQTVFRARTRFGAQKSRRSGSPHAGS
jgi:hypothetical protein